MEKTDFENLQIYRCAQPIASGRILLREAVGEVTRIIGDFLRSRVALYMKPNIGCAGHIKEAF